MTKYRLTVVSAYHGNQEMTQEFMTRLSEQLTDQDRVILVSSGNQANVGEIVWQYPGHWEYVTLFENKGFSAAMNAGLEKVEDTEYVCILGNDGFFHDPKWVDKLIKTQQETLAWIVAPQPTRPNITAYEHNKLNEVAPNVYRYSFFPAICWVMPYEVFQDIGFFDEQFGLGTYEDNDYIMRMNQLGGAIVCDYNVILEHRLSQTMGKFDVGSIMSQNLEKYRKKWGL